MQYRQRIAVLGPQEKRSQPREAKRRYWSWLSSLVNFLSNRFTNHATDSRTHPCASPHYGADTDNTSDTPCRYPNRQTNRTTGKSARPATRNTTTSRPNEFPTFSKLNLLTDRSRITFTHLLNGQCRCHSAKTNPDIPPHLHVFGSTTDRLHMSGIPRDLPRPTRLVPMMHKAATGDTQRRFQLGMITQRRVATQASGVQQVRVQLGEQALALGEELRRLEVTVLAILFLMQALDGLQGVAQIGQMGLHHYPADTEPR